MLGSAPSCKRQKNSTTKIKEGTARTKASEHGVADRLTYLVGFGRFLNVHVLAHEHVRIYHDEDITDVGVDFVLFEKAPPNDVEQCTLAKAMHLRDIIGQHIAVVLFIPRAGVPLPVKRADATIGSLDLDFDGIGVLPRHHSALLIQPDASVGRSNWAEAGCLDHILGSLVVFLDVVLRRLVCFLAQ